MYFSTSKGFSWILLEAELDNTVFKILEGAQGLLLANTKPSPSFCVGALETLGEWQ